ncbi:MAG: hypothetical protein O3A95_08585 [Planctomycetota bacterium]|nr:hypothetical protein [Planctomycetota bacterium]MDA1114338.1 hypothetical protein [Planctomycetota bacterium]
MRMLEHGLDLGSELTVEVCGVDGLGRPCLMLHVEQFQASVYDKILLLIARLRGGGERYRDLFARPNEPRLFLLAPSFPDAARERLELLASAFPLRCFRIGPPENGRALPSIQLVEMISKIHNLEYLSMLDPKFETRFARRLLQACSALQPAVLCQGGDWPLLLTSATGPVATLMRGEDHLYFAVPGKLRGSSLLLLQDDDAVDLAIDHLLRMQEKGGSNAA